MAVDELYSTGSDQDELVDVAAVVAALDDYTAALTEMEKAMTGTPNLISNKAAFDAAWKSENASEFIAQYGTLITSISEAIKSLESYKDKINSVVLQFQGFDNTIQKES